MRVNINLNGVDRLAKTSPVIDKRKVRVKTKIANKVLHSSEVNGCSMYLILGKGYASRRGNRAFLFRYRDCLSSIPHVESTQY